MRYNSSYSRERVKDNVINRNMFAIQNELTAVSRAINTWPYYDITGAVPGEGKNAAPFIQSAIDAASSSGGGVVLLPSGLWYLSELLYNSTYDFYYLLEMRDNVVVLGLEGSSLKIGPGFSTQLAPKAFTIFASSGHVTNFAVRGVAVDFNGANNQVSAAVTKPHLLMCFYSNDGRGDDIEVSFCRLENSAGSNVIMCSSPTGSASQVLGENWLIAHNKFKNNGLCSWDHSTIWAWARDVKILYNDFDNDTMPTYLNIKCAAEMHGRDGIFRGNHVNRHTQVVWIAPNFTEAVENVHVDHNIGRDILASLAKFWRYDNANPEKETNDIYIEDNVVDFVDAAQGPTDAYSGTAVQIYQQLSVNDIYVRGNTLRKKTGGSYLHYGARILPTKNGEAFTRLFFEDNTIWGMTIGILMETYDDGVVDLGSIGTVVIDSNRFYNPRPQATYYPNPICIRGLFHASLPAGYLKIINNEFEDFEIASNEAIGIYLTGPITILERSGNRFTNIDHLEMLDGYTATTIRGDQAYYSDGDFDNNEVLVTGITTDFYGEITVRCASAVAMYRVDGSGTLTAISANASFYIGEGHASTINVYFEGGVFKVQNKSGIDDLIVKVLTEPI